MQDVPLRKHPRDFANLDGLIHRMRINFDGAKLNDADGGGGGRKGVGFLKGRFSCKGDPLRSVRPLCRGTVLSVRTQKHMHNISYVVYGPADTRATRRWVDVYGGAREYSIQ